MYLDVWDSDRNNARRQGRADARQHVGRTLKKIGDAAEVLGGKRLVTLAEQARQCGYDSGYEDACTLRSAATS